MPRATKPLPELRADLERAVTTMTRAATITESMWRRYDRAVDAFERGVRADTAREARL